MPDRVHIGERYVNDMGSGLIHDGYDYAGRYQQYNDAVEAAIKLHTRNYPKATFLIVTMDEYPGVALYFKRNG